MGRLVCSLCKARYQKLKKGLENACDVGPALNVGITLHQSWADVWTIAPTVDKHLVLFFSGFQERPVCRRCKSRYQKLDKKGWRKRCRPSLELPLLYGGCMVWWPWWFTKPKDSICLLYRWADIDFLLRTAAYGWSYWSYSWLTYTFRCGVTPLTRLVEQSVKIPTKHGAAAPPTLQPSKHKTFV